MPAENFADCQPGESPVPLPVNYGSHEGRCSRPPDIASQLHLGSGLANAKGPGRRRLDFPALLNLVRGDPSLDIGNTRNIELIVRDGTFYDPAEFDRAIGMKPRKQ